MKKQKIIVALSGGVDSSIAALLLVQQGYQVEALFMKNWEEDDDADYCAAEEDLNDASEICKTLGIKLHTVNFSTEYWDNVFQHFLNEYQAGRTPNPDILCNKEIKFKAFLEHAKNLGAQKIAMGHYARLVKNNNKMQLLRAIDNNKDQSYFLSALNQYQLEQVLFPIGELEKPKIRKMAKQHHLITHNKKDSTGICFIGERRFNTFLEKYLPAQPGDIITTEGDIIGQHNGLMYYTLGQRKGLGIGGIKNTKEEPWYVVAKNLKHNRLTIAQGHHHPAMFHDTLQCSQLNWIANKPPTQCLLTAKIRYRQIDQDCSIKILTKDKYQVHFKQAQRAITPGQFIVFYNKNICLGGGVIETMFNQ